MGSEGRYIAVGWSEDGRVKMEIGGAEEGESSGAQAHISKSRMSELRLRPP